jgi:hydrogenase maturation protease
MSDRRILVAGIGNVFFGDDAFGVEVARRLAARPQPPGVDVADVGIRGLDLAYALADGYAAAVLVDAMPRGAAPGTLTVLEPESAPAPAAGLADTHGLDPATIVRLVRGWGVALPALRVVGCEPALTDDAEMSMGLSAPVAAAVDEAVVLVEAVVAELRRAQAPLRGEVARGA